MNGEGSGTKMHLRDIAKLPKSARLCASGVKQLELPFRLWFELLLLELKWNGELCIVYCMLKLTA